MGLFKALVVQLLFVFSLPNQTSPFLLALSGNSRELVLD